MHTTALDYLSNLATDVVQADLLLLDVGPSLGALSRSALLACDVVVLPLAPDLFSRQGLKNVGPMLLEWRRDWTVVRNAHLRAGSRRGCHPTTSLLWATSSTGTSRARIAPWPATNAGSRRSPSFSTSTF